MRAGWGLLLAGLTGCQAILGLEEGKPREGTGGGTTSSSATSSSSAGGAGGAGGATGSTGGGGAGGCAIEDDGLDCTFDECEGGKTVHAPKPGGAACDDGGGKVCDGEGACVACVVDGDCNDGESCESGACVGPSCSDDTQNGGETGVDCGGPCPICPTVLALAAGAGSLTGGVYSPGGAWSTSPIAGSTADGVALTLTGGGTGVGLARSNKAGSEDHLQFTLWSGGGWTALTDVGAAITTRARPAIASGSALAQAVFQGTDYKFYFTSYSGIWAGVQAVGAPANFGPVPADIAARGGDATIAFVNGAAGNDVYALDRTGGAWVDGQMVGAAPDFDVSPAIAPLAAGPELMLVYVRKDDGQLLFSVRLGGVWSVPAVIPSALSKDAPAVAGLPGGGALVAFRGTDGKLYTAAYAGNAWSAPVAFGNVTAAAPPAVARGVGGAEVELAWVDASGKASHARRVGGVWSAAVPIATGVHHVALASGP